MIGKFKECISKDLPPYTFGNGNQQGDFISVEDAVEAIVMGLEPSEIANTGTFNIGTGVPTKIGNLSKTIADIMGKPYLNPIYKEAVEGDIRLSYADTSNAAKKLKFNARKDLVTGLKQFIQS